MKCYALCYGAVLLTDHNVPFWHYKSISLRNAWPEGRCGTATAFLSGESYLGHLSGRETVLGWGHGHRWELTFGLFTVTGIANTFFFFFFRTTSSPASPRKPCFCKGLLYSALCHSLLSMQPRIPSAFLTTRAYCWIMFSFISSGAFRTFSAAQPPAGTGAWVVSPHMQGLVLYFLELLEVPGGPPCQPAEISLEGSTALLPDL